MKRGYIGWRNRRIAELEHKSELTDVEIDEIGRLRLERAETNATRRTEFERGRLPLFADQIPEAKAEDYIAADKILVIQRKELHRQQSRRAAIYRRALRAIVDVEVWISYRERWRRFQGPHDAAYAASYWLDRFREATGWCPHYRKPWTPKTFIYDGEKSIKEAVERSVK